MSVQISKINFKLLAILLAAFVCSVSAVTVDNTFSPVLQNFRTSSNSSGAVVSKVQPDGKILVGGSFKVANGLPRSGVVRFNADGTIDASFDAGDISTFETILTPANGGTIQAIAIQPDGKILIGGSFRRGNETIFRFIVTERGIY